MRAAESPDPLWLRSALVIDAHGCWEYLPTLGHVVRCVDQLVAGQCPAALPTMHLQQPDPGCDLEATVCPPMRRAESPPPDPMFENRQTKRLAKRRNTVPGCPSGTGGEPMDGWSARSWVHDRAAPMTMNDTAVSHAPMLRDWFLTACSWVAAHPPIPRQAGLLEAAQGQTGAGGASASPTSVSTPACAPARQGGAEADAACPPAIVDIQAQDWDLLFRAALAFLQHVAVEGPQTPGTGLQFALPAGSTLQECLGALDQLRRSVPAEQSQPRSPMPCSGDAFGSAATGPWS